MYKNMIGLEAEFLLRDGKGNLVFPGNHGFGYDEWPILGEIRGDPADNTPEAVANLIRELYTAKLKAVNKGLVVDLAGWATITPDKYKEAMRKMGTKVVPECKNIYGSDIMDYDDRVVEDGKVKSVNISTGLHIHFSSLETHVLKIQEREEDIYEPATLQFESLGPVTVYHKAGTRVFSGSEREYHLSRITKPVVEHIVKAMDDLLPSYTAGMPKLKYRMPGFYEVKPHGFEYRSLPFSEKVFEDLENITEFAFETLKSINL
jgi:hypothetical protein